MALTITNITQAASAVVTVNATGSNPFSTGNLVAFAAVVGMTQINGTNGTVIAIGGSSGAFTATFNINSTAYTAYSSGGTATILTGVAISGLPTGTGIADADVFPWDQGSTTIKQPATALFAYFNPRTAAEIAAGVTPTNYAYPVGSDQRYGAVGNGTTDDTAALTAMFNVALQSKGIQLTFRGLTYGISAALPQITVNDVQIVGFGPDGAHNGGSFPNGTTIKWIGSSSTATMVTIAPTSGNAQYLTGIKFTGISFDCNAGTVANGLLVQSVRYSQLDYFVKEAGSAGATYGAVATLTSDPCDCQFNRINHRGYQNTANGYSLVLTGTSTANTSFNLFETIDIFHTNTAAINSVNCDNNFFEIVRLFHNGSGSATYSWLLQGGTSSAVSARSEQIWKLSATLPVHWIGATNYSNPPTKIYNLDKGNGSPDPVQDIAGQVYWQDDTTPLALSIPTNYTPTIAGGGTGFVAGTVLGRYRLDTHSATVWVSIAVTTAGTGSTQMTATLPTPAPVAAGALLATGAGIDTLSGAALQCYVTPGSSLITILKAGGYPAVNSSVLDIEITYEV